MIESEHDFDNDKELRKEVDKLNELEKQQQCYLDLFEPFLKELDIKLEIGKTQLDKVEKDTTH